MIRDDIQAITEAAAKAAMDAGALPQVVMPEVIIERPARPEHGDYACSLPMRLARAARANPLEIAKTLLERLPSCDTEGLIETASVAGGGFLNLTLKKDAWRASLKALVAQGRDFGTSLEARGKKAVVEFISANPTGPVHIGNARGGPLGDAIASLLRAVGYEVVREFYLNDVGGQIDKLGKSIYHSMDRGSAPASEKIEYQGGYVEELLNHRPTNDDERNQLRKRYRWEIVGPNPL